MSVALAPSPLKRTRAPHLGATKFLSVGATHAGRVRTMNEDRLLNRPAIGLWAVADGMGGHADGAAASTLTVDALDSVTSFSSAYSYRDGVFAALHDANARLRQRASLDGMSGSTVVALLAHHNHYACVWAGDSRAYRFRGAQLERITRDHSLVQEMVEAGLIGSADARRHPKANVITRALGAADAISLDCVYGKIEHGDRFLLCSDGITAVIDDHELSTFLNIAPLQAGVDAVINLALRRGATDNITALIVAAEPA